MLRFRNQVQPTKDMKYTQSWENLSKPLIEGAVNEVHPTNEGIGTEMFNSTGLYMGGYETIRDAHTNGTRELYNNVKDPAQNNNIADQNPSLVQKMEAAYQNYSKSVVL